MWNAIEAAQIQRGTAKRIQTSTEPIVRSAEGQRVDQVLAFASAWLTANAKSLPPKRPRAASGSCDRWSAT
jgi:hypothetical protein